MVDKYARTSHRRTRIQTSWHLNTYSYHEAPRCAHTLLTRTDPIRYSLAYGRRVVSIYERCATSWDSSRLFFGDDAALGLRQVFSRLVELTVDPPQDALARATLQSEAEDIRYQ